MQSETATLSGWLGRHLATASWNDWSFRSAAFLAVAPQFVRCWSTAGIEVQNGTKYPNTAFSRTLLKAA